ncbi:hypothetical protein GGX14DRAFT_544866 [Mycena pura]|uniref:Uncharacterized protein n=1 Tax=Mycena pura TaxID=153505 RepID=A0AAD6Y7D9_9AGAR|nr:hypothetical protein GGX14DRAFT_544866 [Mycena pura]
METPILLGRRLRDVQPISRRIPGIGLNLRYHDHDYHMAVPTIRIFLHNPTTMRATITSGDSSASWQRVVYPSHSGHLRDITTIRLVPSIRQCIRQPNRAMQHLFAHHTLVGSNRSPAEVVLRVASQNIHEKTRGCVFTLICQTLRPQRLCQRERRILPTCTGALQHSSHTFAMRRRALARASPKTARQVNDRTERTLHEGRSRNFLAKRNERHLAVVGATGSDIPARSQRGKWACKASGHGRSLGGSRKPSGGRNCQETLEAVGRVKREAQGRTRPAYDKSCPPRRRCARARRPRGHAGVADPRSPARFRQLRASASVGEGDKCKAGPMEGRRGGKKNRRAERAEMASRHLPSTVSRDRLSLKIASPGDARYRAGARDADQREDEKHATATGAVALMGTESHFDVQKVRLRVRLRALGG